MAATILVTGGSGFIGSALIRELLASTAWRVVNVDALTCAAVPGALACVAAHPRYVFEQADIRDRAALDRLLAEHRPDGVMHLAAESHVDRSISGPADCVSTNVNGTLCLLEAVNAYRMAGTAEQAAAFRFLHVSTDEVYGALGATGRFTEDSPCAPSSPYAASKAGADHLVQAWHRTYGLATLITHGTNTYGPWQAGDKLVPLMALRACSTQTLPVYGQGQQVRDWLHVDDHARALIRVFTQGQPGQRYNIGAGVERRNIDIVRDICRQVGHDSERRIVFVDDRAGHDWRYALDCARIRDTLGWQPQVAFEAGLADTVRWYIAEAGRFDVAR